MSADTLQHPTLRRTLRGKPFPKAVQFRNLKYASIPARWKDSIPNDALPGAEADIFDATRFGASCPQKRGTQALDLTLIGAAVQLPLQDGHDGGIEKMDEFECLTVNVTVPKSAMQQRSAEAAGKRLPVFVWVHGGALSWGSNSWPQYDLTRFIERSIEIGQPVIGVSINYRVGVFGFLASRELGSDGNFGFKDQVLAFRWIRRHIAGFGGDPGDITASAESAGAISLSALMCADIGAEGLFERAVIMSGEVTLRKPRGRKWQEEMYREQLRILGLDGLSVGGRTRRLREMSAEELADRLPVAQHFCACIDRKFVKNNVNPRVLRDSRRIENKPEWCMELVTGDTAHDGTCLKSKIIDRPDTFAVLQAACARFLTPNETAALFSAYKLPASSSAQQELNLLELTSELRFYLPTLTVHASWKPLSSSKTCGRYHFHLRNPVEGPFKGLASHELDVALLLGNHEGILGGSRQDVGMQMADRWIRFVNRKGWCDNGKVVVIGDEGITEVDEGAYDRRYRAGRGQVLEEIGLERLWMLVEEWQGVRSEGADGLEKGRL